MRLKISGKGREAGGGVMGDHPGEQPEVLVPRT